MIDKPRLIDADKMLEWMSGINIGFTEKFEEQLRVKIFVKDFDPDPPQQLDIKVGDVPQHILSAYKETNSFLHYNGKIYRVTQRLTGFECVSNGGDTP